MQKARRQNRVIEIVKISEMQSRLLKDMKCTARTALLRDLSWKPGLPFGTTHRG